MRSFSRHAMRTSLRFMPPHQLRNGDGIHHVKIHVSVTQRLRALLILMTSTVSRFRPSSPLLDISDFSGIPRASNMGRDDV